MAQTLDPSGIPHADPSIRRTCFYADPVPHACPRCGARLAQMYGQYVVATRNGAGPADDFLLGGTFGSFCLACPTVVVKSSEVRDYLAHTRPDWNVGTQYAVLGMLDLDAIPEDNRHVPLGGDDNPTPLVPFDFAVAPRPPRTKKRPKRKDKRRRR